MYLIQIDEAQRKELLAAIKFAGMDERDRPLEYWENMLEELPKNENQNPGITHGFCL